MAACGSGAGAAGVCGCSGTAGVSGCGDGAAGVAGASAAALSPPSSRCMRWARSSVAVSVCSVLGAIGWITRSPRPAGRGVENGAVGCGIAALSFVSAVGSWAVGSGAEACVFSVAVARGGTVTDELEVLDGV